jgi:hypothetical protein
MININKIVDYMNNKKVLNYHGSNGKNYKYYIKEINNDLVTISVDEPIKNSVWESDHQLWTVNQYNLLSNSTETNTLATWGQQ